MKSLQNLSQKVVAENFLEIFSKYNLKNGEKLSNEISNNLINTLLDNIPKNFDLEKNVDVFSLMTVTEFCEKKHPLSNIATTILLCTWKDTLQKLVLPEETDFSQISFDNSTAFTKLKHLEFHSPHELSKENLLKLISCLPNDLQSFTITYSDAVDDEVLDRLSKQCPHVKSLSITGCRNVKDFSFDMQELQVLNLNNTKITDMSLSLLGEMCGKSLAQLNLNSCENITQLPKSLTTLQRVDLSRTSITNEALEILAASCGNSLIELRLRSCENITQLPKSLTALQRFELCNTSVTNEALEILAASCGNSLRELHLYGCDITQLPKSLTALQIVNLDDTSITYKELESLVQIYGKSLERLIIDSKHYEFITANREKINKTCHIIFK